ncbi:spore coat protein U domain-containing protein [bacterium]|nr:spore coat protein U domain-containing protein [bacterium]
MVFFRYIFLVLIALSASFVHAQTQSASTPVNISANLVGQCSVVSIDVSIGDVQGDGDIKPISLEMDCSAGVSYTLGMDGGNNFGSCAAGSRCMVDATGVNNLRYDICKDPNCSSKLGIADTISGSGNGPVTLYIQVNSDQSAVPGQYSDQINCTVGW